VRAGDFTNLFNNAYPENIALILPLDCSIAVLLLLIIDGYHRTAYFAQ
jgi:hypothetical protein